MRAMDAGLSPLVALKFALWLGVAVAGTVLLRRRRVTPRVRLAFLATGTLLFGFVFGLLAPAGALDPNPVLSVRGLLRSATGAAPGGRSGVGTAGPAAAMVLVLLAIGWVSNKSFCGWACPLGLLQDLIHRLPAPKWKPSLRLTNGVRVIAFGALVVGLAVAGLDWTQPIDPFQLFRLNLTMGVAAFGALVLLASLVVYRPWCCFLCPFGLMAWVVEQLSLLRPRIDRRGCRDCRACVRACPTEAMAGIYAGNRLRADCYACGSCPMACPRQGALGWRATSRAKK